MMYGFAAVSREPRPLPMMKIQAQKPPKLWALIAAIAQRAPTPSLSCQKASLNITSVDIP